MRRIDRDLLATPWPAMRAIDSVQFQPGDVLLLCGGFEDRSMSVLNMAATSHSVGLTVLDIEYKPSLEPNHFPEISDISNHAGWNHIRIEYDRCNPSGILNGILKELPSEINRLYIDISGMSRLLIVQLIVGLLEQQKLPAISILYTEALIYPPTESEARAKLENNVSESDAILSFISIGVYDLAVVPELSSSNINQAPIRLIAFPSFNPAQLFSVKSIIQPSKTTLIHGVPPDVTLNWRTEVICLLNKIGEDLQDQSLKISTLQYSECLGALLKLYEEWSEFNSLVISPTGSKMQTVAVGIFKSFIQDIQVVYPTPLHFTNPTEHTCGTKQTYELCLDSFIALRKDQACGEETE